MEPMLSKFQKLVERANAEFEIRCASLRIGEYDIDMRQPADPEAVLDDEALLRSHGELEWQPYWAQTWDASLGMSHFLAAHSLHGKHVLDLGCGTGLTSALLLAGGATIVCGDNAPPSLLFAEINTWPWRDRCQVKLIDWHKSQLPDSFDVIVGSDIVYDRKEVAPLDKFFREHLAEDGYVLLSDPSRPMTREYLTSFAKLGWKMDEQLIEVADVKQPVRIVTMRL